MPCHNAYMRAWRATHPQTDEQRRRSNARSYTHSLVRRGILVKQPCEQCGKADVESHHPDYSRPREVVWLCRPCHLELHRATT